MPRRAQVPRLPVAIMVLGITVMLATVGQQLMGLSVLPGAFLLAPMPCGLLAAAAALLWPGRSWQVRIATAALCLAGGVLVVSLMWQLLVLVGGP